MSTGRRYTQKERESFLEVISANDGNLHRSLDILVKEGISITYPTLRKIWLAAKESKKYVHTNPSRSKFPPMLKKEAVKLLEINDYDYKKTIELLKNQMEISITSRTLRNWYYNYAREVCDDNRFSDNLKNLSNKMTSRHEVWAGLVYDAKELILRKLIELIPLETNIDKLANVYRVLEETSLIKSLEEKPFTMIQQFNNYISSKALKEKNKKKENVENDV